MYMYFVGYFEVKRRNNTHSVLQAIILTDIHNNILFYEGHIAYKLAHAFSK